MMGIPIPLHKGVRAVRRIVAQSTKQAAMHRAGKYRHAAAPKCEAAGEDEIDRALNLLCCVLREPIEFD
jgi:hypothetical protein